MMFSAICLTYGRPEHLEEAVEAFRNQRCNTPREMIVFNTAPQQKLELSEPVPGVKIINADSRMSSLGAARNLAIAMANGTHIVTWDDDDIYLPNYLETFAKYFAQSDQYQWVWAGRQFYSEKGRIIKLHQGTCNTLAFTKAAWEAAGYYSQINVGEDREFVARVTSKTPGLRADISPQETGFIYCWGNGVHHISGMGDDARTATNSWKRAEADFTHKLSRGILKPGKNVITPQWRQNYEALASEFLRKQNLIGEPIDGLGVVLLGRHGDIINALPILKRRHEEGKNPHLIVAEEFAGILDGVSYVKPFPVKLKVEDLNAAMSIARSRFTSVERLQIYGANYKQERLTESYNAETWREAGMLAEFRNPDLVPVFDRRDKAREAVALKKLFRTNKPKIVTNLTGGVTSSLPRGPAILAAIKSEYGSSYEVVEIGRIKLHRIYDTLAMLEQAALLVTVDTSTLHLAAATKTPVMALINGNQWLGSSIRFNSVAALRYTDVNSKVVIAEMERFLGSQKAILSTHDAPAVPVTLHPFVSAVIAVYKPNIARLNKCLQCVLPQVAEVIVCGDADTPWPIKGLVPSAKIKLVRHSRSATGYGRKAHLGAQHASGKTLLFLNDDVYLDEGTVETLTGELINDVAIVTHLLRYMDGSIQYAGKVRHGDGFVHVDLRAEHSRYTEAVEQESACGASMLIRRDVFFDVGGFDPRYLLYAEDDDLAMTVRQHGWRIMFTPKAWGLHEEHTSTSITPRWLQIMEESNAKFAAKWRDYFSHNPPAHVDTPAAIGTFPNLKEGKVKPARSGTTIVRRRMAAGDVLLATPVIAQIARENPQADLMVETEYPEIFKGNESVRLAAKRIPAKPDAVKLIDLTMAYENRPDHNYLYAYSIVAGVTISGPHLRPVLNWTAEREFARNQFGDELRWCVINAVNPDTNRQWPLERYAAVIKHLHDIGFQVAEVGKYAAACRTDLDLTGKTTIHQMAALIEFSKLFIGVDSLPLHIASATGTTAIGLFGVTLPECVLAVRDNIHVVTSGAHPFTGARHKLVTDTIVQCGSNPMEAITPAMVIQKIDEVVFRL